MYNEKTEGKWFLPFSVSLSIGNNKNKCINLSFKQKGEEFCKILYENLNSNHLTAHTW